MRRRLVHILMYLGLAVLLPEGIEGSKSPGYTVMIRAVLLAADHHLSLPAAIWFVVDVAQSASPAPHGMQIILYMLYSMHWQAVSNPEHKLLPYATIFVQLE